MLAVYCNYLTLDVLEMKLLNLYIPIYFRGVNVMQYDVYLY